MAASRFHSSPGPIPGCDAFRPPVDARASGEAPPRPCSERRAAANRENAKKSTGPRTRAGKDRCRFNAVVHGATASLSVLPGESPAMLRRFVDRVYADLRPAGQAEAVLVDQYASIAWKLRRLGGAEKAVARRVFFREVDEWFENRENLAWAKQRPELQDPEDRADLAAMEESLPKRPPDPATPGEMLSRELHRGRGPLLRLMDLEMRLRGTLTHVLRQIKDLRALRRTLAEEEREAAGEEGAQPWTPGEWDVDDERSFDAPKKEEERERNPAKGQAATAAAVEPAEPEGRVEAPQVRNRPNEVPAPELREDGTQVQDGPTDAEPAAAGDGACGDAAAGTGRPISPGEDVAPPMTPIHTDGNGQETPSSSV